MKKIIVLMLSSLTIFVSSCETKIVSTQEQSASPAIEEYKGRITIIEQYRRQNHTYIIFKVDSIEFIYINGTYSGAISKIH